MPDDSPTSTSELTTLHHLDAAWATGSAGSRLRAVRSAAERLRDHLLAAPRTVAVRTLPLTTLLYPTKHAFWGAAISPAPFVVMHHRCLLVQFLQRGELKTLLFNPTDTIAARQTPYFRFLVETMGEYLAYEVLTRRSPSLESQLSDLGLKPTDIDYLAFDHFHTQDLRSLLGTTDGAHAPRFPRARLLAPRVEWEAWDDLHPLQRAWFVAEGKQGTLPDRVLFTAADLELGDGVWLLRTPGHTAGNQTLFMSTETGIWGSSENATSADCYSPFDSGIAGLRLAARQQQVDLILNANTPEMAADQYTSMVLERTLVDRVKRAPAFVQMFPSSEVTPSAMAPGLHPTMIHGSLTSGQIARS